MKKKILFFFSRENENYSFLPPEALAELPLALSSLLGVEACLGSSVMVSSVSDVLWEEILLSEGLVSLESFLDESPIKGKKRWGYYTIRY